MIEGADAVGAEDAFIPGAVRVVSGDWLVMVC